MVNAIVEHSVDDTILQETEKGNENLSVKNEAHEHENTNIEMDEKDLYEIDNFLDKKKNVSMCLKAISNIYMI